MSEDVPCPDPNEVVTRAILREVLQKELANYVTKEDLFGDFHRQMLALHEQTRDHVRAMFDPARDAPTRLKDHDARIGGHDERIAGHDERIDDHEDRIVRLELQPAPQPRALTRTRTRTAPKPKRSRR